jgi:hypothetical protein
MEGCGAGFFGDWVAPFIGLGEGRRGGVGEVMAA